MIGGNRWATLERMGMAGRNEIGEMETEWEKAVELCGYLDTQSGTTAYQMYGKKTAETTDVFVCGYKPIEISEEELRLSTGGKVYDVLLIDDPMDLHDHLEIYLKGRGANP